MTGYELTWIAYYEDGTKLLQYENGKCHKYLDIDRSKLSKFAIHNGEKLILVIHLDKNKKLIFRRRVAKPMLSDTEEVVYLVGWQENRSGVNVQSISFIFQEGYIETVDGFKENHKWFYPINFMKEEQV